MYLSFRPRSCSSTRPCIRKPTGNFDLHRKKITYRQGEVPLGSQYEGLLASLFSRNMFFLGGRPHEQRERNVLKRAPTPWKDPAPPLRATPGVVTNESAPPL